MRILAVVPAYNEQEAIGAVVAELKALAEPVDVLVVDDGSSDETAARARAAGARVCTLPCNMGIGVAVQTGFMYAVRHGYAMACQFDGDGQHVAGEIAHLTVPILSGEADVVIGSRFLGVRSHRPPLLRRIGILWLRGLIGLLTGARLTDVTSGFRAYGARAVSFLAEHYPAQFPEPESIVALRRHGFRITEVPVQMRDREHGRSSIGPVKSFWYAVRVSLGVVVTSIRARALLKEAG